MPQKIFVKKLGKKGDELMSKLPGKTKYSGRRRTATRRAGFTSHPDSTGGEYKIMRVSSTKLRAGKSITISFLIPKHLSGDIVAFGGWFCAPEGVDVSVDGGPYPHRTLVPPCAPNWSKFGSMWRSEDGGACEIIATFAARKSAYVAFYELGCGILKHKHLDNARPELMRNMYQFSPEAHFFGIDGEVLVDAPEIADKKLLLHLKSCNRCARFLPINRDNELIHLSFSNHCKAAHLRPCSHTGFGRLTNAENGEHIQLEYGYQLECRFCKKFEVNAAHNPQRTAAQMKEDGARRRALELLLTELFGGSPQLLYRHQTGGHELADDVWGRFCGRCFNCGDKLETKKKMHLDHTRPLALLWPLDGTATCLCGPCNSEKRDRPPATFYTKPGQLEKLSEITGIPLAKIKKPNPNLEAIRLLKRRLNWFSNDFCQRPELTKEHDGKVAFELLIKAIQKALNRCPGGAPFDLAKEYERHFR